MSAYLIAELEVLDEQTRAWFESDSCRRALEIAPRAMGRRMSAVEGAL